MPNGIKAELDQMFPYEQDALRELLNLIIIEGQTYPKSKPLSKVEFAAYWMTHDAFVATYNNTSPPTPMKILGAFYLKPNFPGWCSHICNAGFIVQPA